MPRKAVAGEGLPRRRRGSAAAVDDDNGRGLALRIFLHSPKDMLAGLLAFAAVSAIVANALFLQHGPHPAPMFGSVVHIPQTNPGSVGLLPRPRPTEADAASMEPRLAEPRPSELRLADIRASDPKSIDPLGTLVKATTTGSVQSNTAAAASSTSIVLRPPAPVPPVQVTGSRRVAAVQRVLTEYGYGQLRATGTIGADTQTAIRKFESERRLPVTGQMSDRLVRELTAMTGHPVD